MNLILVSDFGIPSGYQAIAEGLALRFIEQGHRLIVLGVGYDKREINYQFGVLPVDTQGVPLNLTVLIDELKVDWILFLMDSEKMLKICIEIEDKKGIEYFRQNKMACLFPVESDPFIAGWAESVKKYFACKFTFTKFSQKTLSDAGVRATTVGVGLGKDWSDDKVDTSLCPDSPYILTVAANQIRKNWPDSVAIFKKFSESHLDHKYVVVTVLENKIGWALQELFVRYGIADKVRLGDSTEISRDKLKGLYSKADCLLHPAHTEGIGLPIYEAQALGCPAVATNCTNIVEAVGEEARLINVARTSIFPWGNTTHYWVDVNDGASRLANAVSSRQEFKKIVYPTWDKSADIITKHLQMFDTGSEALNAKQE